MTTRFRQKTGAILLTLGLVLIGQRLHAEDAEGPKVYYKDGLHIDSADGNNTFLINGRVQTRFTYDNLEDAADDDTFAVQRGEIRLDGNVFTKKLKYGLELSFSTRSGAKTASVCADATCTTTVKVLTTDTTTGLGVLNDYYIDYIPLDAIGIKVGQFKVPFLYTELVSAMKQEFPDRNLVHDTFTFGRDLGVDFHGSLLNFHLNYDAFAMNGDGQNNLNKNQGLLAGVRLTVPILGEYKYVESDVDYTEEPALGVGLAYLFDERGSGFENNTIPANAKASHQTFDIFYRSHGFSLQAMESLSRANESPKLTNFGYTGQIGYFIVPKHLEVAARAGGVVFSNAIANQYEYNAMLGYYFNKHNLKLQTDYSLLQNVRGLNLNDHRFRTQLTVVF